MSDVTEKLAEIVDQGPDADPDALEKAAELATERLHAVNARLAELKPPPGGSTARVRRERHGDADPYEGAGSAWREAAEDGDSERLAELELEREELHAERSLLERQRRSLKAAVRQARERRKKETAPERLEERLQEFSELLEETEDALQAFRDARDALEEAGREIVKCRKIVGEDAAGLSPEEFRRWGLLLAPTPGEPGRARTTNAGTGRPVEREHLFATPAIESKRWNALEPPREELVEAVRRRVTEERDRTTKFLGPTPDVPERRVRDAVESSRRDAIRSGDLEELEVERETVGA